MSPAVTAQVPPAGSEAGRPAQAHRDAAVRAAPVGPARRAPVSASPRLVRLRTELLGEAHNRLAARLVLADFWASDGAATPLVEPAGGGEHLVTFLHRDATAEAVLCGVNRVTERLEDALMHRMEGTDLWHRTFRLPSTWRGSYSLLAVDGAGLAGLRTMEPRRAMREVRERGALDPRNPLAVGASSGPVSVAVLPRARALPYVPSPATDDAPRVGRSPRTTVHIAPSGRRVWVHRPPGAGPEARPLAVVLDGEVRHRYADVTRAVDSLAPTLRGRAPYLLLVDCHGGPRRRRDLGADGTMSEEIVGTLVPWVRAFLPVSAEPADVLVTGESLGGLTALRTVLDHPGHAGTALAQSPSLWQDDMLDRTAAAAPSRLHITAGRRERGLVEACRRLEAHLAHLPHETTYVEFDGGHDAAWWLPLWVEGIVSLLRGRAGAARDGLRPSA